MLLHYVWRQAMEMRPSTLLITGNAHISCWICIHSEVTNGALSSLHVSFSIFVYRHECVTQDNKRSKPKTMIITRERFFYHCPSEIVYNLW